MDYLLLLSKQINTLKSQYMKVPKAKKEAKGTNKQKL